MSSAAQHPVAGQARLDADVCVIGTGMGGTAVAEDLAARGVNVLAIEAGNEQPDDARAVDESTGTPLRLRRYRAVELGGGSNLWHGVCSPLDDVDFMTRSWIPDSGWPIARSDLVPYYERATAAMEIGSYRHFDFDTLSDGIDRARDIVFDTSVLSGKLFQFRDRALRLKPRWRDLISTRKLRCLTDTRALELVCDEAGGRVSHVKIGAGERRATVHARAFVVCAGALETPRLLLNSVSRHPAGIGNDRGVVGRYLLDHPAGHFQGLAFARMVRAPLFSKLRIAPNVNLMMGLTLSAALQAEHRLPNHYLFVRPRISARRVDPAFLTSLVGVRGLRDLKMKELLQLADPHVFYRVAVQRLGLPAFYRYADLFFMTEQMPSRDSFVALSQRRDSFGYPIARVNWKLSEADHAAFERFARLALERGLGGPSYRVIAPDSFADWRERVSSAAHFLGTARMADDPSRGVVDRNLRVFGTENLFVCDGAVFPTAGSTNPSFTIFALGLRLAAHLKAFLER